MFANVSSWLAFVLLATGAGGTLAAAAFVLFAFSDHEALVNAKPDLILLPAAAYAIALLLRARTARTPRSFAALGAACADQSLMGR